MDRTTRWETEAIRKRPPQPSRVQKSGVRDSQPTISTTANWVTLREAEAETGIPVNTLRKWIRRADLPSYLEADGDLALRMVDLDAVVTRANELGRDIAQPSEPAEETPEPSTPPPGTTIPDTTPPDTTPPDATPPGTMIVPVDAWNKMLNQLGNLHEAGQQLAVARERAAKAETEATFLRAQLAETRNSPATSKPESTEDTSTPSPEPVEEERPAPLPVPKGAPPDSTTYWRYLTSGWRERKKRRG